LSNHTGQTVEKIEKDSNRDYWMTSDEAKEYGLIDEVLITNSRKQKK
jgi:ATP-dependent Clp protease protease subunit